MPRPSPFISAFLVSCLVFCILSFGGIFGSIFYTTGFILAKIEKYDGASRLIASLLQNKPNSPHPYELAGDISYALHENTGNIVEYYTQALVYDKNPRILEKIRILKGDSIPSGKENQQKEGEKILKNNTGTTERLQKIQEIEQTQSGQKNAINPYSTLDSDTFDTMIPNANTVGKKDW